MATIVTYRKGMCPVNAYPARIVSPERPGACCATDMIQIGDLRTEGSGLYYYQRCRRCGFTVRHCLPRVTEQVPDTIPEVGGIFKVMQWHASIRTPSSNPRPPEQEQSLSTKRTSRHLR